MFSSPEKRTKKESIASKNKQDSNNQSGFDKNENTSSKKLDALDQKSKTHSKNSGLARLQEKANNNNTGLPDQLKLGMETISGISLDDVKVNYNSDKPSDLGAHAYAKGNQIHLAGGQEKHLAHEAWHVIQQKQGRVDANSELGGKKVNNSENLEREADVMGAKALTTSPDSSQSPMIRQVSNSNGSGVAQMFLGGLFGREEKKYTDIAATGAGMANSTVAKGLDLAGNAASADVTGIGGMVTGGYNALAGTEKLASNAKKRWDASSVLAKTPKEGGPNYDPKKRAEARLNASDATDGMASGFVQGLTGSMNVAAGTAIAGGVTAPAGAALSATSAAISGTAALAGAGIQNHRDSNARRMRDDSEILQDKKDKNIEREKRREGSILNPMNWWSKARGKMGAYEGQNEKLGLTGEKGNPEGKDDEIGKAYVKSKNEKYKEEGWNISKNDEGVIDHNKDITKERTDISGSLPSLLKGEGTKKTSKTFNTEEQYVTKGKGSKAKKARLEGQ